MNAIAVLLIGNLIDDDPVTVLCEFLGARTATNHDRSASRVKSAVYTSPTTDDTTRWKIRSLNNFHQLVDGHFGVFNNANQCITNFTQVMRWNRRCHADSNSASAIDKQVRKFGRKYRRFVSAFVIVGRKVNCVELDVFQHGRRDLRHSGFGVPHRRGRQTSNRSKIALLVDQDVPHVPLLSHPHKRGIDDLLTVRMVVSHRFTGDLRALGARG